MLNGLEKMFRFKPASAKAAKNRLQLVLAKERIGLSESQFTQLKEELCQVLSHYFEVDSRSLEIDIRTAEGQSALNVNTPIRPTLRRVGTSVTS